MGSLRRRVIVTVKVGPAELSFFAMGCSPAPAGMGVEKVPPVCLRRCCVWALLLPLWINMAAGSQKKPGSQSAGRRQGGRRQHFARRPRIHFLLCTRPLSCGGWHGAVRHWVRRGGGGVCSRTATTLDTCRPTQIAIALPTRPRQPSSATAATVQLTARSTGVATTVPPISTFVVAATPGALAISLGRTHLPALNVRPFNPDAERWVRTAQALGVPPIAVTF